MLGISRGKQHVAAARRAALRRCSYWVAVLSNDKRKNLEMRLAVDGSNTTRYLRLCFFLSTVCCSGITISNRLIPRNTGASLLAEF